MDPSWRSLFDDTKKDLEFLKTFVDGEFYPPRDQIFTAFTMPVTDIKVVILGQDPYHGPGQAHGLSFSVPVGVTTPPSLRNIFKELTSEFPERGYKFEHGNLDAWHARNIFLLNATLTVAPGQPNSHMQFWSLWTNKVIEYILEHNKTCIFLLLGAFAQTKANIIDDPSRWVFGIHPSPLSAHRGFFGSGIFKRLEEKVGSSIDWQN